MRHGAATIALALLLLTTVFPEARAHWQTIHHNMATDAMRCAESAWGETWLPGRCKAEIWDGSWEEDGGGTWNVLRETRTRHHGYNPITGKTGGVFLMGMTAPKRAEALWGDMMRAMADDRWTGGDGVGAFHYLGRCCHLVQDMTTWCHVHPQGISRGAHRAFERVEEQAFARPHRRADMLPLTPADPLPIAASEKLDDWTKERLGSETFPDSDVVSFVKHVARITYFRATFWGEVAYVGARDGGAAPEETTPTRFADGAADAHPNTLGVMFGAGNIRYRSGWLDDWFEIVDGQGKVHVWQSALWDDGWHPCAGDSIDGCRGRVASADSGAHPVVRSPASGGRARVTGRFVFVRPFDLRPERCPDGSRFGPPSLGHYISDYALRAGTPYNAGLIALGAEAAGLMLSEDFARDLSARGWSAVSSSEGAWPTPRSDGETAISGRPGTRVPAAMQRGFRLAEAAALAVEFRAAAGGEAGDRVTVTVRSGDGAGKQGARGGAYRFTVLGGQAPCFVLSRCVGSDAPQRLDRAALGAGARRMHVYRVSRDGDGTWRLLVDGSPVVLAAPRETSLRGLDAVGVELVGEGSRLGHLRVWSPDCRGRVGGQ